MIFAAARTPDDDRWYRLSIGAVVLAAWAALALWGASPFAGLLSHREIGEGSYSPVFRVAIFVAGWVLMTIAMMLPGSLPLINLFRRLVGARPDRTGLVLRLVLGYLGVWALFGLLAFVGDAGLHAAVGRLSALGSGAGGIAAGILLAAGLYQFTPLKHACLDKCRTPYSFLAEHWHGRQAGLDALGLGTRHGLFCVGCCWTVMLLMFAVGGANLGWMLALGAVMAAERATRWGRLLTPALGAALVVWSVLTLAGKIPFPGT